MTKPIKVESIISAKGVDIAVWSTMSQDDFISLTDMAKYKNKDFPAEVVRNWLRVRNTIEYLGVWEQLYNPRFNMVEFDQFKNEAGTNAFVLSPAKWIEKTSAVGLISKSGRHGGGTFAHKDIAFKFAAWLSVEFELYIIKDYQRLKEDETHRLSLDWNVKRILAKANYRIHTDAIKSILISPELSKSQQGFVYADEADMLNVALFGMTAKQWRESNSSKEGNIRDYATIEQLLVMANLENANALFIQQGKSQHDRISALRNLAVSQLKILTGKPSTTALKGLYSQLQLPEESNK